MLSTTVRGRGYTSGGSSPGAAEAGPDYRECWSMRLGIRSVLIVAVAAWLLPAQDALAWGPAMHVGLAGTILEHLSLLPAAVAGLLARHAIPYLYGNIAADVVFAKRLSRIRQSCHHWSTGLRLLDSAADQPSRAFAHGYLSHLAADTVAHAKFVPRQIVLCDCSINFGHFYWELRADAMQSDQIWSLVQRVLQHDHTRHHNALAGQITDTLLSFDMNRLLFDRMNALAVRRGFRRTVTTWSRYSRFALSDELLAAYADECLDRIRSVLTLGPRSLVLREDPNGTSALMLVRVRRREARRLRRGGRCVGRRMSEVAAGLAPAPAGCFANGAGCTPESGTNALVELA